MADNTRTEDNPPEPPDIERRLSFHPLQLFGVPLLMLIPILALLGVFGDGHSEAQIAGQRVELRVVYPERMRYKAVRIIGVSVRNTSAEPISGARLVLNREYFSHFTRVAFTPAQDAVDAGAFYFDLPDLLPGDAALVEVEIEAALTPASEQA